VIGVRPYASCDLEMVAELFTTSVHELTGSRYSPEQRQAWAPRPPDLKQWEVRLRTLQTLIAEVDARAVGFLSYQSDGYVDLLYVRPQFERTGVATHLYEYVERIFVATDVASAYTEASLIAQPFFVRHGFHTSRFEEIRVSGTLLQRWVMFKSLVSPSPRKP
jgi:putative acetyltransferase